MTQIAIDIVLLPDEATQKICREINSEIGGKIDFTNTGKVPHISLMMGIIDESGLEEIQNKLSEISKKYGAITANATLKKYEISNTGENGASFALEENIAIQLLFTDILTQIRPLLSYKDISTEMFYQAKQAEQQSCVWVQSFENKIPHDYHSHITLGIGDIDREDIQINNFILPKLAIYQLGNYCTCENKLFEIEL